MNDSSFLRNKRGFTLLEALIAVVVLSVGMLSVARLHTELVASGGLSKARSEAVQLAESDMETLRNMVVRANYDAFPVGTTTINDIQGTNATFALTRVVAAGPGTTTSKQVDVVVAWADPKEGAQQVRVSDILAWNDPAAGALASSGSLDGGNAPALKPPTGKAKQGGRTYDTLPTPVTGDGTSLTAHPDGTYDYLASDGKRELLVQQDNIWVAVLTIEDGSKFSSVSGKVYNRDGFAANEINRTGSPTCTTEEEAAGTCTRDQKEIYVVSSDASYCSMTKDPVNTPSNLGYEYFSYTCYVGAEWYGNVGVVRIGGYTVDDQICVGDPLIVVDSGAFNTRFPKLSTVRNYRGFETDANGLVSSVGIGINADGESHYTGHNFLLATLHGQAQCGNVDVLKPALFSNTAAPTYESTGYIGNPGKGFCLNDSPLCYGDAPPPPPDLTITVSGTFNDITSGNPNPKPEVASVSIGGVNCTTTTQGQTTSYVCTRTLAGWSGTSWSATLSVDMSSGYLCGASGSDGSPLYTYAVVGGDPGTLTVNDVTISQTAIVRNLSISKNPCP